MENGAKIQQRVCCVEGCGKPHKRWGYCNTHSSRIFSRGTIELQRDQKLKERKQASFIRDGIGYVALASGEFVLVDEKDFSWATSRLWCLIGEPRKRYAGRAGKKGVERKTVSMHTDLMSPPLGYEVDHINGNGLDNRRSNLRITTCTQNHRNKRPENGRRFKGTSKEPSGRYRASIRVNGKRRFLGTFVSEHDAALAYNVAAQLFWGEYAWLNQV